LPEIWSLFSCAKIELKMCLAIRCAFKLRVFSVETEKES
jgi:hypothetical protein